MIALGFIERKSYTYSMKKEDIKYLISFLFN